MSYLIPVLLFVVIVAVSLGILRVISEMTAGPDGEKATPFAEDQNSPLGATDEASDAGVDGTGIDAEQRERDEREAA
jgi:hypothetical protein